MAQSYCWTHGIHYDGWECPRCSRDHAIEEQARAAEEQHEEQIEALDRIAKNQADQAARNAELIEAQMEAAQDAAREAAEEHKRTTANAWKLQSRSMSKRAESLCDAGDFHAANALALKAADLDPGNIDAFNTAAAAMLALHEPLKARNYIEKQIQKLNLPDYSRDPSTFAMVLKQMSLDATLLEALKPSFTAVLRKHADSWAMSNAEYVPGLIDLLASLGLLDDAVFVAERLRGGWAAEQALVCLLALVKTLVANGKRELALQLTSHFGTGGTLIIQSYLYEVRSLLGLYAPDHLRSFLQSRDFATRTQEIEYGLPAVHAAGRHGRLSEKTVGEIQWLVFEQYRAWLPAIEQEIFTHTMDWMGSPTATSHGGRVGVLAWFVLVFLLLGIAQSQGLEHTAMIFISFGALFGGILIGTLTGKYQRLTGRIAFVKVRLAEAFAAENRRLMTLGLPQLTPSREHLQSDRSARMTLVVYVAIIAVFLLMWTRMMLTGAVPPRPS
jgi:hypothetical protein